MTAPDAPRVDIYKQLQAEHMGLQDAQIIELKGLLILANQRNHQLIGQLQAANAQIAELKKSAAPPAEPAAAVPVEG